MEMKYNFFLFQFTTQLLFFPKEEKHFRETSSYGHQCRPPFPNWHSLSSNLHASMYASIHVIQVIINLQTGIEIFSSLPDH